MGVALPTGYIRTTNEPLDALYLDAGSTLWANVAAATNQTTGLSNFVRYIGQFVNIDDGSGGSELYWFKDGITDPDLVPFAAGGGGTYTGASPTTVVVENYTVGTSITGLSYDALFENIYAPYVTPTIPTFSASFATLYECGDNLTAIGVRFIGLTVNINTDEYWFKNAITNGSLILKGGGSGGGSLIDHLERQKEKSTIK